MNSVGPSFLLCQLLKATLYVEAVALRVTYLSTAHALRAIALLTNYYNK